MTKKDIENAWTELSGDGHKIAPAPPLAPVQPSEALKENVEKSRKDIDATESILASFAPRLLKDYEQQPASQKRVVNEQVRNEPIVFLESKGKVIKQSFITDFLTENNMTPGDMFYYRGNQKQLFEYIKKKHPAMDTIKIPSAGILFYQG